MTDRMAALSTLSLHAVPGARRRARRFLRRYRDDPLIIDKWFALQATTPEPATLDRVRALTAHPAFSMANPNRVRSLIGAFAQGNQTQFNRPDGAGYEFVADTMLALDPDQSAGRGAHDHRVQELARARAGPPGARGGGAAAGRRPRRSCRATSATSCSARSPKREACEATARQCRPAIRRR